MATIPPNIIDAAHRLYHTLGHDQHGLDTKTPCEREDVYEVIDWILKMEREGDGTQEDKNLNT